MQGAGLEPFFLRLPAGCEVPQYGGNGALAPQPHFTCRHFHGESAAILAPTLHIPDEAWGVVTPRARRTQEFGNKQAEIQAHKLRRRITEHGLGSRIDGADGAAVLHGDDAVHHGVQDGLDEGGAVLYGLLGRILFRHVAKHQHGTDDLAGPVPDGRATVGDGGFAAIPRDQYGRVGQALDGTLGQGFHDRDQRGESGFLVDDLKNFRHRAAQGLGLGPAGELFRHRVQERHAGLGIRGHDGVADGVQRDGELFLTDLQRGIGLLQCLVHAVPNFQQIAGFQMQGILELQLGFPINQPGEGRREQQGKQAGEDEDAIETAHVGQKLGLVLGQGGFLQLDEAAHLGADAVHQPLALAAADEGQACRQFMATAQVDDLDQFRQLGIHQGRHGVQMCAAGAEPG